LTEVLGVIPARAGSTAIPGKNVAMLAGRPLLDWTCEAARASRRLTRTVLTTDSEEIAAAGRRCGIEVPFLRPAALAGDDTPMVDVLRHALSCLKQHQYEPSVLVLLQPTSPLRRAEHIDSAVDLLLATGADTVVSVVAVPHQFTPGSLMRVEGERLVPVEAGGGPLRRQDKPVLYARNGPAVLAVRKAIVVAGGLYGPDTRPLVMAREESIDIDDAFDLQVAEALLTRRPAVAGRGGSE
jgi:CMP-N-acetylneuraminic acid synthetase